jgi:hypothetical protein
MLIKEPLPKPRTTFFGECLIEKDEVDPGPRWHSHSNTEQNPPLPPVSPNIFCDDNNENQPPPSQSKHGVIARTALATATVYASAENPCCASVIALLEAEQECARRKSKRRSKSKFLKAKRDVEEAESDFADLERVYKVLKARCDVREAESDILEVERIYKKFGHRLQKARGILEVASQRYTKNLLRRKRGLHGARQGPQREELLQSRLNPVNVGLGLDLDDFGLLSRGLLHGDPEDSLGST